MATPVILPKFDMTMEEGTIARWLKQDGERVEIGEPLVEIVTDKVNMEVESPASGFLAGIRGAPGEVIPVTHVIAYIVQPGESVPSEAHGPKAVPEEGMAATTRGAPAASREAIVPIAPGVRRLAEESGVDLTMIAGTGPVGRITESDVRAAIAQQQGAQGTVLAGRRRTIAHRMAQSAREIPHIYLTRAMEMSSAAASRGDASYTAVVVWAAGRALKVHPLLRSSLEADVITVHEGIHIGVAVDTDDGVIVPVVKDAQQKTPEALHQEIEALSQRAREGILTREEVVGGVFTVSNLGMFNLDHFTTLIFPPQVALLAVGAVRPRPWVVGDRVVVRPVCHMTLALDHRVADGAEGSRFLADIARWLEEMHTGL